MPLQDPGSDATINGCTEILHHGRGRPSLGENVPYFPGWADTHSTWHSTWHPTTSQGLL